MTINLKLKQHQAPLLGPPPGELALAGSSGLPKKNPY
jgi:hypothetical protein